MTRKSGKYLALISMRGTIKRLHGEYAKTPRAKNAQGEFCAASFKKDSMEKLSIGLEAMSASNLWKLNTLLEQLTVRNPDM